MLDGDNYYCHQRMLDGDDTVCHRPMFDAKRVTPTTAEAAGRRGSWLSGSTLHVDVSAEPVVCVIRLSGDRSHSRLATKPGAVYKCSLLRAILVVPDLIHDRYSIATTMGRRDALGVT